MYLIHLNIMFQRWMMYVELVTECIAHLDEHIVIHRLTGDGNVEDLIAPLWSTDKRRVLKFD